MGASTLSVAHPSRRTPSACWSLPLVAVGCAQRKERTERPRLIDGASERWPPHQPPAVGTQLGEFGADVMRPVGIEQRGRSGTVGQREFLARRPLATLQ